MEMTTIYYCKKITTLLRSYKNKMDHVSVSGLKTEIVQQKVGKMSPVELMQLF